MITLISFSFNSISIVNKMNSNNVILMMNMDFYFSEDQSQMKGVDFKCEQIIFLPSLLIWASFAKTFSEK